MSPLGIYGSPMHVLTNKKVEDKKGCFKEQIKTGLKDSFKATAAVAGITAGAAGTTAIIDKVKPSLLDNVRNGYRTLSKKTMQNYDIIGEKIGEEVVAPAKKMLSNFNKIPAAGKVAIAVAVVSSAIIGAVHKYNQIGKMGGIEGKYENK